MVSLHKVILALYTSLQFQFQSISATSTNNLLFVNSRYTSTSIHTNRSTKSRANPAFQFKNKSQSQSSKQMKNTEIDSSSMSDASTYSSFASAAVDISQARVISDNVLTFLRSARDIDDNSRRRFLHHIVLNPTPHHEGENENENDNISGNMNVNPMILPPTQLSSNIQARIPSPSGHKIAIFTKNNDNQQSVEIWTENGTSLSRKIPLPKTLHGDICFDTAWFGSLQWNKDETAIVYSAEMNPPTVKSFFDLNGNSGNGNGHGQGNAHSGGDENTVFGATNTLGYGQKETWGEKYTNTSKLKLYILQVDTGKVAMIPNVPGINGGENGKGEDNGNGLDSTLGGYSLGQAVFSPDGNSIVYTAWDAGAGGNMPKRLGSIYCYQRHCAIYQSPIETFIKSLSLIDTNSETSTVGEEKDGTFTCLTPSDRLARSPRFVVDVKADDESSSTKLVWLSNSQGFDTHGGCMGLSSLDWNTDNGIGVMMETRKSIVDVIHHPEDDDAFPGLFLNQLPLEPFVSKDGKYLFVTTQWRSTIKVVKISIATGDVQPVTFNLKGDRKMSGSQTLLCMTSTGDAIVTQSEPSDTPALGFVSSTSLLREGNDLVPSILIAEFGPVAATSKFPAKSILNESEKLSYRIIRTHPQHGDVQAPVEGILLLPPNSKREKVPLVVVPHGGPHSCTPTAYIPSYAYLCQGGKFGILHVNYRGSTGFGQAALESLAGNIGDQDVRDVVHLTKHVLEEFKDEVDASKVGVCGGSHGGFLAGHLIGQYPELFKVAAMRNPVTNIATMTTATDIPDWTYVECLGPNKYDWTTFCGPNKADLSAMWDASPIAHIEHVTAPTLLAIGNSDKRVPPSQGIEYYHALRSQGVNTKLLLYDDDDHAIDKVQSEADHWINILQWFVSAFA